MNFWATLCVPCRQEIPELNKLKAGFAGDSQILFVACNTDDSVRTNQSTGALEQLAYVQDMTRNEEYTKWEPFNYPLDSFSFRHYFRARPLLDSLIPSSGIPVTLVLDERGIIRDIHTGYRVDHMQELLGNKIRELQARQVPR